MKRVYLHKESRRLEVGKVYEFLIVKLIDIPADNQYYVLQDKFLEKHLLLSSYYSDYEFVVGQKIKCHVDKVNCKGQIFLEPLHPAFIIGNTYTFKYIKKLEKIRHKGKFNLYYLMKSQKGYLALLEKMGTNEPQKNTWLKCEVIKIKKAKVYLKNLESNDCQLA